MSSTEGKDHAILARTGVFLLGSALIVLGTAVGHSIGGASVFGLGIALVAFAIIRKAKVVPSAFLVGMASNLFIAPYLANLIYK